ncbi:MAG: hypothetical protein RBS80_27325 [Thermoguttaceae bacterium]|jgi:biotin carboxylase|nr:hypothetical protein [Thermoguttaceae bacterium]
MATTRQRLLIAGGGYADVPLILAARTLGFHVMTTGNRPEDLGHPYADEYHAADYSDLDAMLSLARSLHIDAICACCNDFSALSAAYVAERLDLPGHDPYATCRTIHHKDLYRQFALANGIAAPCAEGFSDASSAMAAVRQWPLPVIVKPVDLTGGKGIATVHDVEEAEPAVLRALSASRAGRIVIEECLQGSRHGMSMFLHDGKVVFFFSDDEYYFKNPYLVSAASAPSTVPAAVEKTLCADAERIASLLSLKTGIFHLQYILQGEEPVIIEICRRAPGDLYVKFVEIAAGVPFPAWIVNASAGLDCGELRHAGVKGCFTRHCIMSANPGRIRDIVFDRSIIENIIDKLVWWKAGDEIGDAMTAKGGIVFLRFDTVEEMVDKTIRMQDLIRVVTR